jgi:hypothetical protein
MVLEIQVMVFWVVTLYYDVVGYQNLFTLKMEAAWPPEMLVSCHITTQCHHPEDCDWKGISLKSRCLSR